MQGKVQSEWEAKDPVRIGELAGAAGITSKTLRFYEEQGLIPAAPRTPAGYRDYAPDVLARIDFIHRGQAAGLTLAQIGQILAIRDDGQAPCEHVRDLLDTRLRDLDAQISQLVALRDTITQLRVQADNAEPATCGADRVCRYL